MCCHRCCLFDVSCMLENHRLLFLSLSLPPPSPVLLSLQQPYRWCSSRRSCRSRCQIDVVYDRHKFDRQNPVVASKSNLAHAPADNRGQHRAEDVLTSKSIPVRTAATGTIILRKVVVAVILGLLTFVGNVARRTSPQANPTMHKLLTKSTLAINSVTSSILFPRGTKSCKHANQAVKRNVNWLEPHWCRLLKRPLTPKTTNHVQTFLHILQKSPQDHVDQSDTSWCKHSETESTNQPRFEMRPSRNKANHNAHRINKPRKMTTPQKKTKQNTFDSPKPRYWRKHEQQKKTWRLTPKWNCRNICGAEQKPPGGKNCDVIPSHFDMVTHSKTTQRKQFLPTSSRRFDVDM